MPRRKILLISLICFAAITAIRETGIFHFNYYSSDINSNTKAALTDKNNTESITLESDPNWQAKVSTACNVGFDLRDCAVKVIYKSFSYGESSECNQIVVDIKEFKPGPVWTPLYKYSNFSATANINAYIKADKAEEGKLVTKSYTINGPITVNGTIKIWGISSHLNAKHIILRQVMQAMHKQVKDHLRNMKN